MLPVLYPDRETATTFAQPDETLPYSERLRNSVSGLAISPTIIGAGAIGAKIGSELITNPQGFADLIGTAFNQNLKVESLTARNVATEEAYDRRIKAIKEATGITLENPLRGGFRDELARANREDIMIRSQSADQEPAAPLTGGAIFERKLSELRAANPDKAEALAFGDITAEAKAIAKGAEDEYEHARKATTLSLPSTLAAQFIGGAAGQYRDPLFVGSLVAGPTTAVGKTVAARIATAGLFQGLYNMGISAIEQPVVQEWRREIGLRSGVQPALENVGLAFVFGAIPGAVFRGGHEISAAAKASFLRVLDGLPIEGDLEKTMQAARSVLGEIDAEIPGLGRKEQATIKLGEEMDAAEKITRPPPSKTVSPELADDLTTAAQRYGDDPVNAPSPAGVAFIDVWHGSPYDFDAFSASKIGTGEGAQSYGHGIYLAERKDVATHYRDDLTKDRPTRMIFADDYVRRYGNDAERKLREAAKAARAEAQKVGIDRAEFNADMYNEAADLVRAGHIPATEGGVLYRARIRADKGRFLDWDRPLNQQNPEVREAIKRAMGIDYNGAFDPAKAERLWSEFQNADAGVAVRQGFIASDDKLVAARLRDAGIPGIKYLDEGSREGGGGTHNFVVFDEKSIEILAKNDRPIAQEISDRIAAAQPRTQAEAQKAASEAIEDIGNRESIARTRAQMDAERLPAPEPLPEGVKPPPASSKDPLDKIPMARDDGTPTLVSARQAAKAGERETELSALIRECK